MTLHQPAFSGPLPLPGAIRSPFTGSCRLRPVSRHSTPPPFRRRVASFATFCASAPTSSSNGGSPSPTGFPGDMLPGARSELPASGAACGAQSESGRSGRGYASGVGDEDGRGGAGDGDGNGDGGGGSSGSGSGRGGHGDDVGFDGPVDGGGRSADKVLGLESAVLRDAVRGRILKWLGDAMLMTLRTILARLCNICKVFCEGMGVALMITMVLMMSVTVTAVSAAVVVTSAVARGLTGVGIAVA